MDLSQLSQMFEQAQGMKQQMDDRLAAQSFEGASGGGAVTVQMNGRKELTRVSIAPAAASAAADDITMLEDLILAAVNDAARKATDAEASAAGDMLGGMKLPGF